jgi:DNA-binding transcriptional ArsR family regulator
LVQWRANALAGLSGRPLGLQVRDHLLPLLPASSYFPDFLTPAEGSLGLESGLDTVLATPREQIRRELEKLTTRSGAPSWGLELTSGHAGALRLLGTTMRGYFASALAPVWGSITARAAAEHARLTGISAACGVEAMLANLGPTTIWRSADRVLETPYPMALDIRLNGRGLTVIPSWFCLYMPVALADPALPPVLVHPLAHTPAPAIDPDALAKLIGPTRAKILTIITIGTPTSAIVRRMGISASQLSRHAAVLRSNDLISEARHAGRTFYSRTRLGDALAVGPPGNATGAEGRPRSVVALTPD